MRLRNKFMLHFAGLVVVLMTAVVAVVHSRQAEVMIGQARKQGLVIARIVAAGSVNSILVNDWVDLRQEADEIVLGEDIAYVTIYDRDGKLISFAGARGVDPAELEMLMPGPEDSRGSELVRERPERLALQRVLEIHVPASYVSDGGDIKTAGAVQIGVSLESIYRELGTVRSRLVILWGLGLGLGIASSLLLARKVTRPIERVAAAAVQFANGELLHRIPTRSKDEIASLAGNLNHMAGQIHKNLEEIGELNRGLEARVERRTRDLAQSNQDLKDAMGVLQKTQAQLVHSEKMASLGQLVAGVAHEINNPLNFIYNGTGPLQDSVTDLTELVGLVGDLGSLSDEDKERIEDFKDEIDYEDTVEGLTELVDTIHEGARRATSIVKDLRSFSRLDEADLKVADLHEGIEGSINLLRPRLGTRIRMVREYGEIPEFEFRPAQLNQVFMNLLSNAEQAIAGEGTITVRTSLVSGLVTIEVEDDGCGIDEKDLPHIFDPFFTTKDVGQGTGLGLSISFGIVESSGGAIDVKTSESGSCFTVTLPLAGKVDERVLGPGEGVAQTA